MSLDTVIASVRLANRAGLWDVGIASGRIAAIEPAIVSPAPRVDGAAKLLAPGLVDCHIHLDKAEILDRVAIVNGTLQEAVRETATAKAAFTEEDVYARAAKVVDAAILNGTTAMRSFVEIDPRAGLRSFTALKSIRRDYAQLIDIRLCAFAQEGLTNEPQTETLLRQALSDGADLVGGCTYSDPDPQEHVRRIFELGAEFGVAVDFHTDFDLDPSGAHLPLILDEAERRGHQGRIACGHVTKLAAWPAEAVGAIAPRLAAANIGVVTLPATDLFLLGRDAKGLVPRGLAPLETLQRHGVAVALATNNVLNPFTPYGDGSLMRIANLYANVAQVSCDADLEAVFDMVSGGAAEMMGRASRVAVGANADLVLLDAADAADAIRRVAQPLAGWKNGRESFARPAATIRR